MKGLRLNAQVAAPELPSGGRPFGYFCPHCGMQIIPGPAAVGPKASRWYDARPAFKLLAVMLVVTFGAALWLSHRQGKQAGKGADRAAQVSIQRVPARTSGRAPA